MLVLSGVLIHIVRTQGDDYSKVVLTQQNYSSSTISFRRGDITDRNGSLLATSERVYILILDPSVILFNNGVNEAATLEALNTVYGYDKNELKALIEENPENRYTRYSRDLSEEEKNAFLDYQNEYNARDKKDRNGKVSGVWFETEYKRYYPMNDFACTVLGFSGRDASRGNWGLEQYYNDELVGVNGLTYGYINDDGVAERNTVEATNGNTIVSTIDYSVQTIVEETVKSFMSNHKCANLGVIVMDPNNGEILALATDKYYDLNDPTDVSAYYKDEQLEAMTDEERTEAYSAIWRNFAVADAYEPGSTAKPFTVAAALEEGATDAGHEYECTGAKVFGSEGHEVTVKCNKTHGVVTLKQSLIYSCNSAMMDIVERMGRQKFSNFQTTFGFGRQSGVDLPGETAGLVYKAEDMGVTDLATNGF
ncbi:MAG: penicillin-binding protein 2, partial [Lachnospiraceae bacterium]|nr:penicillin-binding protein 2 [Lachnospiraceae bacterium]